MEPFNKCRNHSHRGAKSVIFGLLIITAGVLLLLRNTGNIDDQTSRIIFSWQMLLIAIGTIKLFGRDLFIGLVLISVGLIFMATKYYLIPINFWGIIFPLLIIIIGVTLLFKRRNFITFKRDTPKVEIADYYEDTAVFGGSEKHYKNDNFKGAKITAIFGGAKINLQQVQLSPEGAVIDLTCIFGGCELIVPPDWNIKIDVTNMFGGVSDKRIPANIDESKKIIIKGECFFGGCEIKSYY